MWIINLKKSNDENLKIKLNRLNKCFPLLKNIPDSELKTLEIFLQGDFKASLDAGSQSRGCENLHMNYNTLALHFHANRSVANRCSAHSSYKNKNGLVVSDLHNNIWV